MFVVGDCHGFAAYALVPGVAQKVTAVGEVGAIGGKDFERNGGVVARGLEAADVMTEVDGAGAER